MLNWYQPDRTLRSASTTSLVPNRNRTIRCGRRLLYTSSAALWNPLPDYIKSADTIITFLNFPKNLYVYHLTFIMMLLLSCIVYMCSSDHIHRNLNSTFSPTNCYNYNITNTISI